ncbi:hypothetical protein KUA55_10320 [Enterococcus sp. ALS3]|uniref:LexA repressor DNA-binding domain-containing protein n=1 Tax=Enterococcus alishanensis TaxID=1303817 RepID=A0ABS6TDW2_9ENTE|nr:hypothetical protein [Enterococcus alishanensis]MBV7391077.1 hypothetical protein [Enterococcus alishanensis]
MLTERHIKILTSINDFSCLYGYQPTTREVMEKMEIASTSTMFGHLHRLKDKGYLDFIKQSPRTLHLTQKGLRVIADDK